MKRSEDEKQTLGQYIQKVRAPRSQKWLSQMMNVSQPTVSAWEANKTVPKPEHIKKLELVLKIPQGTLSSLIYGSPTKLLDLAQDESQILAGVTQLSPGNKKAIKNIVDALLQGQEEAIRERDPRFQHKADFKQKNCRATRCDSTERY